MLAKLFQIAWLSLGAIPVALAHSGPHLDDETLEAIFQFMDRTYQGFLAHLPLIASIAAGLLVLLAAVKLLRRRSG
jgi:hypothetical protein